jgi:hypothetical protein
MDDELVPLERPTQRGLGVEAPQVARTERLVEHGDLSPTAVLGSIHGGVGLT